MVGPILKMALLAAGLALAPLSDAAAQGAAPAKPEGKPEMREGCPGLIASRSPLFQPASMRLAALNADQMRITYVGHATFLLESPQLVRIATDYNDYVRPLVTPDIVTMNHAHSTHYTSHPDAGIAHVLRGWADDEKPARIDLTYKDVRVRNVPTNIRTFSGTVERHGNSIFIFEIASLCVAHLGHLHGTLTQQQLDEMGRVDVVMVPVDGSYTLDLDGMVEVLHALKAPLLIPMHYFNTYSLNRFLERMKQEWDIETLAVPSVVLSKATMPVKPKILVLPGH
jgi:L-ascorbate metabolism protein UlaG (beta-lactamase superfamily)